MEDTKYFLTQVKRNNGTITKGCAVYDSADAGRQGYHAYLSAYAFGNELKTDYVFVVLYNSIGAIVEPAKTWTKES